MIKLKIIETITFKRWKKILVLLVLVFTSLLIGQERKAYIEAMGIDHLWDLGIKGEGIVVMDVCPGGVYNHPGLMDKWRGNVSPTGYDWYDPVYGTTVPTVSQDIEHGTETLSCIVGATEGDTIGTAPHATWIAGRITDFPNDEARTRSIIDCLEWVINMPAQFRPDVINLSTADQTKSSYNCYDGYNYMLDQLEELGIAVLFAAGNNGVKSSGIANMDPPQYRIDSETKSFTVGGLSAFPNNQYINLWGFTSRGLSECPSNIVEKRYKPEVLAPAENIEVYTSSGSSINSGTSYASPLVAGGVALLKQIRPDLPGKKLLEIVMEYAIDMGPNGNDPENGFGRVDFTDLYEVLTFEVVTTVQNNKTTGENLIDSYLTINNQYDYLSGSHPEFLNYTKIDIKPKEEMYGSYRFYKWNNGLRLIERNNEEILYTNDEFITTFAETKSLTIRNIFEGVLDGGTILFGESTLPGNVINHNSPYTENAFIYQQDLVNAIYRAEAHQLLNLFSNIWNFWQWDNGSDINIREEPVTLSSPSEWRAKYKGHLKSDFNNAFTNGTQRRLVRTDNGIYHLVYESMGAAWYTHSLTSDFNGEWSEDVLIGNKNPSIDYYGNDVKIVCETYTLNLQNGVIIFWEFNAEDGYSLELAIYNEPVYYDYSYYGYAKPVIADNGGKIFIAYRKDLTHGIYLLYKLFSANWVEEEIDGTDYSSLSPSIAGFYNTVNITYEQGGSIVYQKISYTSQLNFDITETISSGDGFQNNYSPSISLAGLVPYNNGCPVISWIGDNGPGIGKVNGENGGEENTVNVVIRRGSTDGRTWGAFEKVGDNVVSANNNSITEPNTEKTIIVWSEGSEGNYYGKWIRRVNDQYINTQPLSNNGKQNQVSNGTDLTNIGSTALLVNTTPFDVNMSTTDFNQDFGPGSGGTGKISNNIELSYGRQGVIYKNAIEFLFNIGDVIVGDSVVKFINHPDTHTYASADDLNEVVRTEPFNLSSSTEFYFTDFYYVMNPEAADSSLTETDMVNFKAELVNVQTGAVVGTFDEVTYSIQQLEKYNNISYQVDCSNIVEGDYYLRLVTTVAGEADYYLCNVQNDGENLGKRNYNKINFDGTKIPVSYELSQNYPNPFNPSTSIKFQIPESGAVTLKIYDILGREVATLVDEFKTEGRHEVNFNASSLASGVYLYRLEVKSSVPNKKGFADVKKMILLK